MKIEDRDACMGNGGVEKKKEKKKQNQKIKFNLIIIMCEKILKFTKSYYFSILFQH